MTTTLYDEDFVLWSKTQAEALRAMAGDATNQPIDWENVAEEIESLGRSDKRELSSQIGRTIEHLLKLEFSGATDPRAGWIDSIDDARNDIERLLEESPSLKRDIEPAITAELKRASRKAMRELDKHHELDPNIAARIRTTVYSAEQILGDWFSPEPDTTPQAE